MIKRFLIVGAGGMNSNIEFFLKHVMDRLKPPFKTEISFEEGVRMQRGDYYELFVPQIPRGYDAYIVHASRIEETDVLKLRQEEPDAWIFFNSSDGRHITSEMNTICDGIMNGGINLEYHPQRIIDDSRKVK